MYSIKNFILDGFVKVCDVAEDYNGHWYYKNINETVMYDTHKSWVYFIVVGDEIVKVGETGNPLGIRNFGHIGQVDPQPVKGTTSRLGRYRSGDGTDNRIRNTLREEVNSGLVSFWARKCDAITTELKIAGRQLLVETCFHKDLEMQYLNHFPYLPRLNRSKK